MQINYFKLIFTLTICKLKFNINWYCMYCKLLVKLLSNKWQTKYFYLKKLGTYSVSQNINIPNTFTYVCIIKLNY